MPITISGSGNISGLGTGLITQSNLAASSVGQPQLISGTAGNGPAFSAYLSSSNQSLTSSTSTTVALNSKEYDTIGAYNNTGSSTTLNGITVPAYSYAPNIAGYYLVTGEINVTGTGLSQVNVTILKNGSEYKRGMVLVGTSLTQYCSPVSAVIYLNGTSDYITMQVYATGTSPVLVYNSTSYGAWNYFQATLIRSA
jgi:hypothetical protein